MTERRPSELSLSPEEFLCHYTTAERALGAGGILASKSLWLGRYSTMRDPFESKEPFLRGPRRGRVIDEPDHGLEQMKWSLISQRDRYGLVSLTQGSTQDTQDRNDLPFLCPWARGRMWEQYADGHAGVCLVFRRGKLLANVKEQRNRLGAIWHQPVTYAPQGFSGTAAAQPDWAAWATLTEAEMQPAAAEYVADHYEAFFFTKTHDWQDEAEYRVVAPLPREPPRNALAAILNRPAVTFGDSLVAVILGEKFPTWQWGAARQVADRAGAETCPMSWDFGVPVPSRFA